MKWTKQQRDMLFSDMTNEQIAAETGRSLTVVRRARFYYTGHTVNRDRAITNTEERRSRAEGEVRILKLAKELNIKIGGTR